MEKKIILLTYLMCPILFGQVGIGTDDPKTTLDVNGNVTIRDTKTITGDAKPLYIDENGLVGIKEITGNNVTTEVFYASTRRDILTTGTGFNTGTVYTLPFQTEDVAYNNAGISLSGNYYKINKSAVYEITGFINFYINTALNNHTFIVAAIDKSTDNGITWDALTGSRPVFIQTWAGNQYHPHNIPSTAQYLEEETLLRIRFRRSYAGTDNPSPQGADVTNIIIQGTSTYSTNAYQLTVKKL